MWSWRRLSIAIRSCAPALLDRPEAPQRFGLGLSIPSRLHWSRHESQSTGLELELKPGVTEKDVRAISFLRNRHRDSEAILEHIGYRVVGRLVVDRPLVVVPQDAFAVFQVGSKQFKVTPDDVIYIEKLRLANVNDKILLNKVMLLGTETETVVGRPYVPKATVSAIVEEHVMDARVIIFKKKRRKNYRRTNGHRQRLTRIRITRINGLEAYVSDNQRVEESPNSTENVACLG